MKKGDKLRSFEKNKIMTDIHYPLPPYKQVALKGYFNESFPISDEIHNTTISLPISLAHTVKDIFKVTKIMNKFYDERNYSSWWIQELGFILQHCLSVNNYYQFTISQ